MLDSAGKIASQAIAGRGNGSNIQIIATNQLTLRQGGKISSSTFSDGNAGNVAISAKNITIEDAVITTPKDEQAIAGIYSTAEAGTGNAGDMRIDTKTGQLALKGGGVINSSTRTKGNAGSINIDAEQLDIDGQDKNVPTGIFTTAETGSSGNAGNLTLNVNNDVSLVGGASISSSTKEQGNAGNLNIYAGGNIAVDSSNAFTNAQGSLVTNITSSAKEGSTGNAGNVVINAPNGRLLLANLGKIQSSSNGTRNAGSVTVLAKQIQIEGKQNTDLETGIVTDSFLPTSFAKAGVILLSADEITLNGGTIRSNTFTKGDAGQIVVDVKNGLLSLVNGSAINTNTYAEGNAGEIKLAAKKIFIDRQDSLYSTGIMSDAQFLSTKGNAGNVFVTSYELTIQNGGQISSSTFGSGKAGNVDINAATITLNNAGIHSASVVANSSETGHIHIFASDWLHLENQAFISIENQATHATNTTLHGDITITAPDIDLKNSSITTESNGNVDAGDIYINFTDKLMMDPSYIKTTANTGNGGDIHINGGKLIYLQGSAFLTSVTGANSKGGDIKVTANSLIMNNAVIQANAVGGSGGDINLNLQSLIPSQDQLIKGGAQVIWQPFIEGFNVIQAASENGVNGSINLTFPQFNISGSISGLSSVALVIPKIDRWGCRGVTTSSNTRGNSLLETILKSKLAYTAENALVRGSTGGIPVTEARYSFIPPANNLPNSTKESSENPMLPISSSNSRILSGESYPCAKLSL